MAIAAPVSGHHHRLRIGGSEGHEDASQTAGGGTTATSATASPDASGSPAAAALAAVLGQVGLVRGGAVAATGSVQTVAVAAAADPQRLGQALSTLVTALASLPGAGQPTASSISADAVDSALATLRSVLASARRASPDGSAASADRLDAAATGGRSRPNLDALNRVLTHYAAQSAAAGMGVAVLEG